MPIGIFFTFHVGVELDHIAKMETFLNTGLLGGENATHENPLNRETVMKKINV